MFSKSPFAPKNHFSCRMDRAQKDQWGEYLQAESELDVEALAAAYAANKRGQVQKVFPPEVAEHLHDVLAGEVPWELTYFDGQQETAISPSRN